MAHVVLESFARWRHWSAVLHAGPTVYTRAELDQGRRYGRANGDLITPRRIWVFLSGIS